jgi:YcaO-like protein with predicted kinase domain
MADPVAAYDAALGAPGVVEFPIDGLDVLDVPVWTTMSWTRHGVFCAGTGYGADEAAARASAWGELAEAALAHETLHDAEPIRGSYAGLLAERGPRGVLDPRLSPLPAGSPWRPDDDRPWLAMTARSDGREVLVPAEVVATEPADLPPGTDPLFTPVTNGLGAGLSEDRACDHGVREILQRDGNSVTYRALDRGIAVDLDGLEDPVARELLERYDEAGLDITVKLAGTSCGAASVYVVGRERDLARVPHPLMLGAAGEAADPRREVAVRKALLEFASSRCRRMFSHAPLAALEPVLPAGYLEQVRAQPPEPDEDRALQATLTWARLSPQEMAARLERIFAVRERVPLASLPDGDTADPLDHGFEVLWRRFGSPDAPALAGKAFVPGLEVESLSYARVGPRNLARLRGQGVAFAGVGAPPRGAVALPLPEGTPAAWLDVAAMDEAVGELYGLYREPARHVAAFAAERA